MLNELGLDEIDCCSGLSGGQLSNIPPHAHAKNNRTLLFALTSAFCIHLRDVVCTEFPDLRVRRDALMRMGHDQRPNETEYGTKNIRTFKEVNLEEI